MPDLSPAIAAAVRAVRGETDLTAVCALLDNPDVASVVALSSAADPLFRVVAALACGLLALLDESTLADPALHDAVERVIWTGSGWHALRSWARGAPAGWGATRAAALIDAVHANMCAADVVAALIGPCDDAAALLDNMDGSDGEDDRAFIVANVIRAWGRNVHNGAPWWAALPPPPNGIG